MTNALTSGSPGLRPVPRDRHVRRTGADYAHAFLALLPQGMVWLRDPKRLIIQICNGLAQYWGFVDGRAADLLERECDPQLTTELLPEWERAFDSPGDCFEPGITLDERRRILVTKITWLGGQSREYFYRVLAYIGFPYVRIHEWSPFMCGVSECGDTRPAPDERFRWYIGAPENRYVFTAQTGHTSLAWFRCGSGQCGVDPHLAFRHPDAIDCLLNKWKPASSALYFDHSPLDHADPMEGLP